MLTVSLLESDAPLVDQTKMLTEYVPDGRLMIGYALIVVPAATMAEDEVTSNVWPAAL